MSVLIGLLYAAIVGALLLGQFKVVQRAISQRTAGLGRFTYARSEAPIRFWLILVLEVAGLMIVALYFLGALAVVLK